MDKITRQVRIEHWTQIMNECLNSGMNKTEWCRASSEKSYPLFMIRCLHLLRSTFRPFTGLVDKYSEKPEKLLVF